MFDFIFRLLILERGFISSIQHLGLIGDEILGDTEGLIEGEKDGENEGDFDGLSLGDLDGESEGDKLGLIDGEIDGL